MKKPILYLSPLALCLAALSGCKVVRLAKISLYDDESRLVVTSFDEKGSISLPTYRNYATGDVPYSELKDFFYAAGGIGNVRTTIKKAESGYQVYDLDNRCLCTFNPDKDTITVENSQYWCGHLFSLNNGIGPDVGSPDATDDCAVHTSSATKYVGQPKAEVYHVGDYNFDIVEKEGKCYVPTQLLSNFQFRYLAPDIVYNGSDFYFSSGLVGNNPIVLQSFYASNKTFAVAEDKDAQSYTPIGDEVYRFAYPFTENDKTIYRIIALTKDGKGQMLVANSPNEKGTPAVINGASFAYNWTKQTHSLLVETVAKRINPETKSEESASQGFWKLPLRETFYAAKKRSPEVAQFTYDMLRFQFEQFYGIKDVLKMDSFDSYVIQKGLKDRLLSLDAEVYDKALAELLMTNVDDGHTHYTLPSIYSGKAAETGVKYVQQYQGPRRKGMIEKVQNYSKLRAQTMKLPEGSDPVLAQGLFMQGSTAVIRFDSFANQSMFVSNELDPNEERDVDPRAAIKEGEIPLAFDCSFYRIKQNKDIKNVVIDLTCNGGGQVMVIPYILAHFTDDPTVYFRDVCLDTVKEFHYKVDLNHDKVYGGEGDTYKGKYNFYVLTSGFSFSCADFLPTFAKAAGIKIIGEKSGGGTCTVGGFSDGSGSYYHISSQNVCVYPDGNTFKHTDAGVTVDYELPSSSWYDLQKLDTFVSGLK